MEIIKHNDTTRVQETTIWTFTYVRIVGSMSGSLVFQVDYWIFHWHEITR